MGGFRTKGLREQCVLRNLLNMLREGAQRTWGRGVSLFHKVGAAELNAPSPKESGAGMASLSLSKDRKDCMGV